MLFYGLSPEQTISKIDRILILLVLDLVFPLNGRRAGTW